MQVRVTELALTHGDRVYAAANATPSAAYTASSATPWRQVDRGPSVTSTPITPAASSAATSYPLKTSAIGCAPITKETTTSSGVTNIAIWRLDPSAMLIARSILSLSATATATQCSAAFPTIPTTKTPMKKGESPTDFDAPTIE